MDLTDMIFDFSRELPANERYNLIDQINRSCCSIPSNIAEGSGKNTSKHFAEFLSIAISSSFELETQLLICERRKYGVIEKLNGIIELLSEVQRMLFSFREYVLNGETKS